jgi:ATP/maltotriose-dependent transcriptional regulator MalT
VTPISEDVLSYLTATQPGGLSVATIRTHLNKVYEKIGVESRVELALYAIQSGEAVM